jgi:hypothetical protein
MASEIELKKHVLDMLRDFMMGEEGKQFTPKSDQVEMEPKGKEGLDEVLSKASDDYEESGEDDGDVHAEPDGDEEEDDEPKGLKAFLAGRK